MLLGFKRLSCSELILCYTILSGSHVVFPKVAGGRTRAAVVVATPMSDILQ